MTRSRHESPRDDGPFPRVHRAPHVQVHPSRVPQLPAPKEAAKNKKTRLAAFAIFPAPSHQPGHALPRGAAHRTCAKASGKPQYRQTRSDRQSDAEWPPVCVCVPLGAGGDFTLPRHAQPTPTRPHIHRSRFTSKRPRTATQVNHLSTSPALPRRRLLVYRAAQVFPATTKSGGREIRKAGSLQSRQIGRAHV